MHRDFLSKLPKLLFPEHFLIKSLVITEMKMQCMDEFVSLLVPRRIRIDISVNLANGKDEAKLIITDCLELPLICMHKP